MEDGILHELIAILLATYNGEKYLGAQIESIISQSYGNWHLFIRDDGSSDGTGAIIENYVQKFPGKIYRVEKTNEVVGSKYNFWALMKYVEKKNYKYFMFCDQDDVWNSNKIQVTFEKMLLTENNNINIPMLIHTDLEVVDEKLNILGKSFIKYRTLNTNDKELRHLLVQNNVTGCTMMINRALLEKALILGNEDYRHLVMHDWWIALVASTFGKIEFVNRTTMKYRQHKNNVIGATKVNSIKFIVLRLKGNSHVKTTLKLSSEQARVFLKVYQNELTRKNIEILIALVDIFNKTKIQRIFVLLKYGLLKQGFIQKIGELFYI